MDFFYLFLIILLLVRGDDTDDSFVSMCSDYNCLCDEASSEIWDLPVFTVDCSFKNIVTVDTTAVPQYTERLDLSANNITEISQNNTIQSTYLTFLKLNKNFIVSISPGAFEKSPNLAFLDLSDNALTELKQTVFRGLSQLKALNLASNYFSSFEPFTFIDLTLLKYLSLSGNTIGDYLATTNDTAINPRLEALYLEKTGLETAPASLLSSLFNLREISLAQNPLTTMPTLPFTLEYLDLSSTQISAIPSKYFENLPALKNLKLNNVPLKEIAEYTFRPLRALSRLELQNCRTLWRFSANAFGKPDTEESEFLVREISFRGSGLTQLSVELQPLFEKLSDLDLQGNPWNCNCRVSWLRKLKINTAYKEHIRCLQPRPLYNQQLFTMNEDQLICETFQTRLTFFAHTLLFVMCLLLTGFAIWLVCLWPKYKGRRYTLQKTTSPSAPPYSRITIEPNRAEEIS